MAQVTQHNASCVKMQPLYGLIYKHRALGEKKRKYGVMDENIVKHEPKQKVSTISDGFKVKTLPSFSAGRGLLLGLRWGLYSRTACAQA